jgi:endonuclease/exonuclease/phosphatase (EEP) superfamily protein YafD
MASSFRNLKTNIKTGVKTGSTVTAKEYHFSASKHSEPISNTKKMLLATFYQLDKLEQSLLVINCHIINFVSFRKFKANLDQVFVSLAQHSGPLLLGGDFNTWNTKRLKYFSELATSFSLHDVAMTRQPKLSHFYQHLDHVYCRGLEVVKTQVHTDIHSSDHFPNSLRLRTLQP